jgi:hypothetical protein
VQPRSRATHSRDVGAQEVSDVNASHSGAVKELWMDPAIASQPPFDALGSFVTQDDFPDILAATREQNRREFGPRADQPD